MFLSMLFDCCRFDKRITAFAEEKFNRDGIDLKTGYMVTKVTDKEITTKAVKNGGEVSTIPYGMMVWSTGIGTRPVIRDFMSKVEQVYAVWNGSRIACTLICACYSRVLLPLGLCL